MSSLDIFLRRRLGTFIQQERLVQMAGLGAKPIPTEPDELGNVLVLVTRGDGLPEIKVVRPDGTGAQRHPPSREPRGGATMSMRRVPVRLC